MRYKNFFLENYKGIKDRLEFDLGKGVKVPHCIIGNNESGKTTILKGIEQIGDLCVGKPLENGDRKSIKPKGNYFSGMVKLGAALTCHVDQIKKSEKLAVFIKDATGEIGIELEFSYEFDKSSFVDGTNKIKIIVNGAPITEKMIKIEVLDLIKENAPDIIY